MSHNRSAPWLTGEGLQRLRGWCLQGLTHRQIAGRMGVSVSTLRRWCQRHPGLRRALEATPEPAAAGHTGAGAADSPFSPQQNSGSPGEAAHAGHTGADTADSPLSPQQNSGSPGEAAHAGHTGTDTGGSPLSLCPSLTGCPPVGGADLYSLAREAGLLPLSPAADPGQLERLVESALLRRALGYRYATVTTELRKDPVTGENAMTITKRIDKDVPPDTSAQLFWLKCRAPERWRDKPADESNGDDQVIVTFDVDEEDDGEEEPEEE